LFLKKNFDVISLFFLVSPPWEAVCGVLEELASGTLEELGSGVLRELVSGATLLMKAHIVETYHQHQINIRRNYITMFTP